MDIVIAYVDGQDPLWQEDYRKNAGSPYNAKRYRDWGTLKYLLRGIEANMPFIRKVYLVVSRESQVPEWVDRMNLHIVLHRDIIPERFLPVFNSTAIELFFYRIPGIDEEFIYFNDDMFPVRACAPEHFFRNGKAAVKFRRCLFASNLFKKHCRNADSLARMAARRPQRAGFIRPQHACYPALKSCCEDLFACEESSLLNSITPLRKNININFYVFPDYAFYKGRTFRRKISNRHFSTKVASADKVCAFLANPDRDFVCINDVNMSPDKYLLYRTKLLAAFEEAFPQKSRFEL